MGELTVPFDYNNVRKLVPEDDRDFQREYEEKPKTKEVQQVCKVWDNINQKIDEINKDYALVNLKGKAAVLHEAIDPDSLQVDVQFLTVSDFHHFHANQQVPNPNKNSQKKEIAASKVWIAHAERREYKGVVFNPDSKKKFDGYYNLYRGLAIKPKKGEWSLMDRHIREVIANNCLGTYYYIKAWLAQMFQEPGGERPGVAIVMRGGQGVGKGVFTTNIGMIFGEHFTHIQSQRHLTGNFNMHLKDKLLVFVDEGFWAGDKSQAGVLRGLITENKIQIEPKGVNPFPVDNHMRFIIASNNDWIVPAGLDERRMFVIDVSSKHQRDYDYFKALVNQMDSGGREAMLYDLLEYDYSKVNLREFPRTEALLDQMLHSASSIEKFWFENLQESLWVERVATDKFYDEYLDHCQKMGLKYPSDKRQFGKELRRLCPAMKRGRPATSDGSRQYEYAFPKIDECRLQFEERVGMSINWDES